MTRKPVTPEMVTALRAAEELCRSLGASEVTIESRGDGRAIVTVAPSLVQRLRRDTVHRFYRDGDSMRTDDGEWVEEVRRG